MKKAKPLVPCSHKFARTVYVPTSRGVLRGKHCKCGHVELTG